MAHQGNPGIAGDIITVVFEWEGRKASMSCELRWLHIQQQNIGRASYSKSLYHAGYKIAEIDENSHAVLRDIVLEHVLRALDEQKANARGIPALAAQSFQTGVAREYLRHEYLAGQWRETRTGDPKQPAQGFTVGADHSRDEIDMLREAWAAGDFAARDMIRRMAEMSTSTESGIPTRRYTP
jgi:hypothetical protein